MMSTALPLRCRHRAGRWDANLVLAEPSSRDLVPVGDTLSGVQPVNTVQAWLHGGPADGSIRPVENGPDGRPPELLMLGGGGRLFVGSSDQPVAPEHPVYQLEPDAEPIGSLWPYRWVETLPAS